MNEAQDIKETPDTALADLQRRFDEAQSQLAETRNQLESAERRREIDRHLMEADTIDLETARLLTELAVAQMDEADVRLAVEDLRRHKPFLFHAPVPPGGGAMAPHAGEDSPAHEAAQTAAATGRRNDLLRYLRFRRQTP